MPSQTVSRRDFPRTFVFGVATSAYQVEGATKEGERGESIWDAFARIPGKIKDKSTADVSADQYHLYKEDVALMSQFGFGAYRFSISWPRIFPNGCGTSPNEAGITYYNNLITALLEKNIKPYVTLYHWDLPNHLEKTLGGWLSPKIVEIFGRYAETCFARFGDRVKHWITFNEPLPTCVDGYGTGRHAPGKNDDSLNHPYIAAHHLLLAHAQAASIYKKKFKARQGGEIGISPNCEWAEPFSHRKKDKDAAERRLIYQLGWFLDPIFNGDYPEVMRKRLGDRLPKFSPQEKELLKNSVDFVGINNYTSRYVAHSEKCTDVQFFYREQQVERLTENSHGEPIGERAASDWLYMVPWGMRSLLNYISDRYDNPPIYITENGMDEDEDPTAIVPKWIDLERVNFYQSYISAVAEAIDEDGVNVKGYFAWSLIDNFEWCHGYTKRFGLVYLDRKKGLTRHPKYSAIWFYCFLKGRQSKPKKLSLGNTRANYTTCGNTADNYGTGNTGGTTFGNMGDNMGFGVPGPRQFGRAMLDGPVGNMAGPVGNMTGEFRRSNVSKHNLDEQVGNITGKFMGFGIPSYNLDEQVGNNTGKFMGYGIPSSNPSSKEKENVAHISEFMNLKGWDSKVKEIMSNNNSEIPMLIK